MLSSSFFDRLRTFAAFAFMILIILIVVIIGIALLIGVFLAALALIVGIILAGIFLMVIYIEYAEAEYKSGNQVPAIIGACFMLALFGYLLIETRRERLESERDYDDYDEESKKGPSARVNQTDIVAPDTDLITPDTDLITPDTDLITPDTDLIAPDTDLIAPDE